MAMTGCYLKEMRIGDRGKLHQINRAIEKFFEIELQAHVSLERALPTRIDELHKEIKVTV